MRSSYEEFYDTGTEGSISEALAAVASYAIIGAVILGVVYLFDKLTKNKPDFVNPNNKNEMKPFFDAAIEVGENEINEFYDEITDVCHEVSQYCDSRRFASGYPCIDFAMFLNEYDFKVDVHPLVRKNTFRDTFKYILAKGKVSTSNNVYQGPVYLIPVSTCTGISGYWDDVVDMIADTETTIFETKDGEYGIKFRVRNRKEVTIMNDPKILRGLSSVGDIIRAGLNNNGDLSKLKESQVEDIIVDIKNNLIELLSKEIDRYRISVQQELHSKLGVNISPKLDVSEWIDGDYGCTYIPIKFKGGLR